MIGPAELVVILTFSVLTATWLVALGDAIRRPAAQWRWTGRPKTMWVLSLVFLWAPAAIAYWLVAFPSLRHAERRGVLGGPRMKLVLPRQEEDWDDPWKDRS